MAGYTPLFSSLTTGTLCGRWPDIGLWPIILSMADKYGIVDCTCAYIASVTGLAPDEVTACMKRFCSADPGSRSNDLAGARLTLLEEHRDWGWLIVNHAVYREKARKAAQDARRVIEGQNAIRMRQRRQSNQSDANDPRRPAVTRADRLSNANANPNKTPEQKGASAVWLTVDGLDTEAWNRWDAYRRAIGKQIKPASREAAARKLAAYGADQAAIVEQSIAQGWQGLFPLSAAVGRPQRQRLRTADEVEAEEQARECPSKPLVTPAAADRKVAATTHAAPLKEAVATLTARLTDHARQ